MNAPASWAVASPPGFYGKVPTKGDFVSRRLGRPFVEAWDDWLQPAMASSREQLGASWTDVYLTSPLWRFCLPPGTCGDDAIAGVLMPSVDRVGRYFPLTIAAVVTGAPRLSLLPSAMEDWFGWAEGAALSCLEDGFDLDSFDAGLGEAPAVSGDSPAPGPAVSLSPSGIVAPLGSSDPTPDAPHLLDHLLGHVLGRYTLWWTTGSDRVAPVIVACGGLPRIGGFAAFLDGQWARWGWMEDGGPGPDGAVVLTKETTA